MQMRNRNLEYYPMGGGRPRKVNNCIEVSNFCNTGLDGVMIIIPFDDFGIFFNNPIDLKNGRIIKFVGVGKNSFNQSINLYENLIWENGGKLQFAYNMGLVPKDYSIVGYLNNTTVFNVLKQNTIYSPPTIPVQPNGIFASLGAISTPIKSIDIPYVPIHYSKISKQYNSNNTTTITVELLSCTNSMQVNVEVDNVIQAPVNTWGIKYSQVISNIDANRIPNFNAVKITGYNLAPIEICEGL